MRKIAALGALHLLFVVLYLTFVRYGPSMFRVVEVGNLVVTIVDNTKLKHERAIILKHTEIGIIIQRSICDLR